MELEFIENFERLSEKIRKTEKCRKTRKKGSLREVIFFTNKHADIIISNEKTHEKPLGNQLWKDFFTTASCQKPQK